MRDVFAAGETVRHARGALSALADPFGDEPQFRFTVSPDSRIPISMMRSDFVVQPMSGPVSPTQAQEVSFLSGVDGTGHIVATSFWTWQASSTTHSNGAKWGEGPAGTAGGTVKYYFEDASNWTSAEKSFFLAGFSLWSDIANIQFATAASSGEAQITIVRGASGSGAFYSPTSSGDGGAGTVGGTDVYHMTAGTLSIDTADEGFGPINGDPNVAGGYAWGTVVHELGHALGLGHGGSYNGSVTGSQQYSAQDTMLWSIMSYIYPTSVNAKYFGSYPVTGTDWGVSADGFDRTPITFMPLDILAAQQLYGLPVSTPLDGGEVFGFHTNITGPIKRFFNFDSGSHNVITLWDMGTGNTLDLSGFSANASVSLAPGTFSSVNGLVNNIAVAFNTTIETAIGGTGDDTFRGSGVNNVLNGGAGNDTAVFTGDHTNYAISYSNVTHSFTVADQRGGAPDGSDTLSQIEKIQFSDGVFTYNDAGQLTSQTVVAGDGSKTVTLFDAPDLTQWTTQLSAFDTLGTLVSQTLTNEGGGRWVVGYDVTNASAVRWSMASFDAGNHQTTLMVTNDNRTHALTIFDVANAYGWADATISYDGNWNQTGLTGTRDDASHTITMAEVAPALELVLWFTRPFESGVAGPAVGITLTGSNEADVMFGFSGNDTLSGGNGDDLLCGGLGADKITTGPGAGIDVVMFTSVADSTGPNYDWIADFNANIDLFDMPGAVTGIDQPVNNVSVSTASFDDDLSTLVDATHLLSHHVVRVLATSGTLAGHQFMVIDANGVAGYQTGEDFVFETTGSTFTNMVLGNFI